VDGDLRGALGKLDALIGRTGCDAGRGSARPARRAPRALRADRPAHPLAGGRVTKPIDLPDGGKLTRFVLAEIKGGRWCSRIPPA